MATLQKVSLTNPLTRDRMVAQINPEKFPSGTKVKYKDAAPPGHSHEIEQYDHTENWASSLELVFMVEQNDDAGQQQIEQAEKTLDSWCYAEKSDNTQGGSPPALQFYWPGIADLTIKLRSVSWDRIEFRSDMRCHHKVAKIELRESRSNRLYGSDVRAKGLQR